MPAFYYAASNGTFLAVFVSGRETTCKFLYMNLFKLQRERTHMTKQSKWLMRGVILLLILTIIWMLYQTSFILQPVVIIIRAIALPFIVAGVGFYLLRPIIRWAEQKGINSLYSITIMYIVTHAC
jgi:Kef-type K+ transport system membrane component KefB